LQLTAIATFFCLLPYFTSAQETIEIRYNADDNSLGLAKLPKKVKHNTTYTLVLKQINSAHVAPFTAVTTSRFVSDIPAILRSIYVGIPDDAVGMNPLGELPKLDPDVHDPQVIAQFDRLTDIIKQEREAGQTEVKAVQERLQAMEDLQADTISATREAENVESAQWFDKKISGLGENFQGALGEGDSASLNSQSKQYTNRAEIAMQISVMESGYGAQGLKVPSRDELFEKASRAVLPDEYQQVHEKKLSDKLGKRAGQHISRAGGQKVSNAQTPADFAVAELERRFGIKP
ncbi:hypothetical protein LCGC14_2949380, partial [marine sediment metagenome]